MSLFELPTPSLLLDANRFSANIARMQQSADRLGVKLRPHLKTMKSANAAKALTEAGACGVTVSTLKEAAYFLDHGFTDITYAVGMVPARLKEAAGLIARGANLKIMTDSLEVAKNIASHSSGDGVSWQVLIEIDSGDHRGGQQPDNPEVVEIARVLQSGNARFCGLLTHGGHSYGVNTAQAVAEIATQERDAVVTAADAIRNAGIEVDILSVGSTPTALFAKDLTGVTEVRAGVYTVFDIDQQSRGVCTCDEIAMSVLTRVIGHNPTAGKMLLDAGGLALSKDRSADEFRPEVGYGQLCHQDGSLIPELYVTSVSQEHGHVRVRSAADFDVFPVGSLLRVLPIHACMTAAAYDYFNVVENDQVTQRWDRVNGW